MATYGGQGADYQYSIPNQPLLSGQKFYNVVNATTGVTQIYQVGGFLQPDISMGTYNPTTKKYTPSNSATSFQKAAFNDPKTLTTVQQQSLTTTAKGIAATGVDPQSAQTQANKLLSPNAAPGGKGGGAENTGTSGGATKSQEDAINKSIEKYEGRKKYPTPDNQVLRYPIDLKSENQDCIKFTIQQYKPSGLNLAKSTDRKAARTPLVNIFLPIPGGISDRNSVDWQSGTLGPLAKGAAEVALGLISGGAKGGESAASNIGKIVGGNVEELKTLAAVKTSEAAVSALVGGSVDIMSRELGAVVNPNLELLFSGPSLRDFSFTFRMSPRSEKEAIAIKTIIRYFKQAMSAKRTTSNLLLKTPHTFAISYRSKNKDHPYLNKFKECALTSCSVNYAPENTYMSYNGDENSMVVYELSLTFQELEPIFDDDYDGGDGLPNNIGY